MQAFPWLSLFPKKRPGILIHQPPAAAPKPWQKKQRNASSLSPPPQVPAAASSTPPVSRPFTGRRRPGLPRRVLRRPSARGDQSRGPPAARHLDGAFPWGGSTTGERPVQLGETGATESLRDSDCYRLDCLQRSLLGCSGAHHED